MAKSDLSLREVEAERAVPWGDAGQFAWHLARYEFARSFVRGKRVIDVGSGEGYGTALLADAARTVVGIDYSTVAIEHARATYTRGNLRFEVVDARNLQSAVEAFEVVVCLEVIEHIDQDDAMLAGLAALLKPGGLLILSTPNAWVDGLFESIAGHEHYEYHINMLTPTQLRRRVRRHFRRVRTFGQSYRGQPIYSLLKALDVFNLRHRLIRSRGLQEKVGRRVGRRDALAPQPTDFQFRRWLVRQSPHTVIVAVR